MRRGVRDTRHQASTRRGVWRFEGLGEELELHLLRFDEILRWKQKAGQRGLSATGVARFGMAKEKARLTRQYFAAAAATPMLEQRPMARGHALECHFLWVAVRETSMLCCLDRFILFPCIDNSIDLTTGGGEKLPSTHLADDGHKQRDSRCE